MRKLILLAMLLAFCVYGTAHPSELTCLKLTELAIERIHPPIRLLPGTEKRESILLRLPSECGGGEHIRPASFAEAVQWLDLALPLDFKFGLTKGGYFNPYLSTPYGASVEEDLFDFFSDEWRLNSNSPICNSEPVNSRELSGEFGCFTAILEELRSGYLSNPAEKETRKARKGARKET
jgi:hypothetical protein